MLLSQEDIQQSEFSFFPHLQKSSSKRQAYLTTKTGALLKGITIRKKKGVSYNLIDVPAVLIITNRPEHGEADLDTLPKLGDVEQMLSELTRDVLRTRLRERLSSPRSG